VSAEAPAGVVYLVGAGPGELGLVTMRAVELVARAEVIAYDRLIPPGLLDLAPAGCELVHVGKRPSRAELAQEGINRLLVERALAGRTVVRLKGGDPFVFGRGGEEAEACAAAGVRFEVVPGITSAIAAPAYAGVPVTHRDLSPVFAVVTGHEQPGKAESAVDWDAVARIGTICVLMAVARLGPIADRLIAAGRRPDTPAVLIERASLPGQRVVSSTLSGIAAAAEAAGSRPPAVLVVGDVAAMAGRTAWFEGRPDQRPLAGQVVLVPRAAGQGGELARLLRAQGAEPLELALIAIEPGDEAELDRAVATLAAGGYAWTALTSRNAVAALRARVEAAGLDARALAGTRLAAVGTGTAAALRDWGLAADLVPELAGGAALGAAIPAPGVGETTVLLPRADRAGPELPAALAATGWAVDEVVAYRTVPVAEVDPDLRKRVEAGRVHWAAFTSPSTVTGFVAAFGGQPPAALRLAAIGPTTAAALAELGLATQAEAAEPTPDALVAAITLAV
jgi:uroporphyrinogen III methyltransferase/synthase